MTERALERIAETYTTPEAIRDKIFQLEAVMKAMPQIEIPVKHHFAPGVYMREIFIPAGSTIVGEIHKTEHLNILSQGELSVLTDSGIKRLTASTVVLSQPGIKRVGFAHSDSVWITVHHNPDNEKDVEKIKDRLVAKSYIEYIEFMGGKKECLS